MLEQSLSPRDEELLDLGLFYINQAHNEGKITLKEWVRLTELWASRVIDEPDEMLQEEYNQE